MLVQNDILYILYIDFKMWKPKWIEYYQKLVLFTSTWYMEHRTTMVIPRTCKFALWNVYHRHSKPFSSIWRWFFKAYIVGERHLANLACVEKVLHNKLGSYSDVHFAPNGINTRFFSQEEEEDRFRCQTILQNINKGKQENGLK